MEKKQPGRIEAFLRDFFKDFGNLAVAVSTMGRFKATKGEIAEQTTSDAETKEDEPRRVLHPSMLRQQPGEFFTPVHHKKD